MLKVRSFTDDSHLITVEGQSGTIYVDDARTPDLDSKEPISLDSRTLLNWGCCPFCSD